MPKEVSTEKLTAERLKEYTSKHVTMLDGKSYGIIEWYPKFAFWYDEVSKKFSIGNLETAEVTEPFCDEIIYSKLPLETWTADYVVVKVGNFYYLADCQGNCYHESKKPYEICRNVFLAAEKVYLINKNLKVICVQSRLFDIFITKAGYQIAYVPRYNQGTDVMDLINSDGETNHELPGYVALGYNNCISISFNEIDNWYVRHGQENRVYFIDNDFKYVYDTLIFNEECKIVGELSQTYSNGFSRYFKDKICFIKYGNVEFVVYKEKTYFFKPDGKIEKFDFIILTPKCLSNFFVYRIDDVIYYRDFEGKIIDKEKLSPKELYQIILNEELLDKQN